MSIKRILITGPEATGKSELSKKLAKTYNTFWNPEYARAFLTPGGNYLRDDLEIILKKQIQLEMSAIDLAETYLFCDTGPEVIKIWSEYKYNACSTFIENKFKNHTYDFTLLTYPDLDWTPDPLRETPDRGERLILFSRYQELLDQEKRSYSIIKGEGTKRLENAKEAINQFFKD